MSLTEETVVDQITADEYGNVSVRQAKRIVQDGEVIATTYHRHVVGPKDDLKGQDDRVQAIAKAARKDAKPLPEG